MNNGGGGFPGTPTAWPAYRGCYPAACTKWDVMINSAKLGELYGVQGMSIVGIVGIPEDIMAQYGIDYDPLPGCSSDEKNPIPFPRKQNISLTGILLCMYLKRCVAKSSKVQLTTNDLHKLSEVPTILKICKHKHRRQTNWLALKGGVDVARERDTQKGDKDSH